MKAYLLSRQAKTSSHGAELIASVERIGIRLDRDEAVADLLHHVTEAVRSGHRLTETSDGAAVIVSAMGARWEFWVAEVSVV